MIACSELQYPLKIFCRAIRGIFYLGLVQPWAIWQFVYVWWSLIKLNVLSNDSTAKIYQLTAFVRLWWFFWVKFFDEVQDRFRSSFVAADLVQLGNLNPDAPKILHVNWKWDILSLFLSLQLFFQNALTETTWMSRLHVKKIGGGKKRTLEQSVGRQPCWQLSH